MKRRQLSGYHVSLKAKNRVRGVSYQCRIRRHDDCVALTCRCACHPR